MQMTRDELYKRIRALALEAESSRPHSTDTLADVTESLAWAVTLDRLLDAADTIRPVAEVYVVSKVA
jgi:hypothetical protein